jgi:hypothetical protein
MTKYKIKYKHIKNLTKTDVKEKKVEEFNLLTPEERRENETLLERCQNLWLELDGFRKQARRCSKYRFGDQYSDYIEGYDDYGKKPTEKEYILSQGKQPITNNLISSIIRSISGIFLSNKTEPEAIARNDNNPKLGEMMSVALQYVHQIASILEKDSRSLDELAVTGMCIQLVRYMFWDEKMDYEANVERVDRNRVFFTFDGEDIDLKDPMLFGVLEDLSIEQVLQRYAHSVNDIKKIRSIYVDCEEKGRFYESKRDVYDVDFYYPSRKDKCRVIQVWEKRSRNILYAHDVLAGELNMYDPADEKKIDLENEYRRKDALANGLDEEEFKRSMEIKKRFVIENYYYVKHLSPRGDVLFERENPFDHKCLPFVIGVYKYADGEIHSFVSDFLDQQRYINRLITMIDFMMSASAKSLLIFPVDCLGEMTKEEVLEEYVKINGVIFAKQRAGMQLPQEISSRVNYMGATEMLNTQMSLMYKVSGVHESMQGMQAKSGTAASLYAQESQNSASNVLDLMETFNSFRKRRDVKLMKTIQQFYDTKRYLNVAGKEYAEESKWYDPQKIRNADFDIAMAESTSTPAYRMAMNNMLMQLVQAQAISIKTMLKGSTLPYKDKLLSIIEKEEQQAQQAQQAMMQGQMPQMPQQNLTQEQTNAMSMLNEQSNPEVMNLVNQALQQ